MSLLNYRSLIPHFPQQKPQVRDDIPCPEEVLRTGVGFVLMLF